MVVLACVKDTVMASTKSDHNGRIDCQHFNSVNTRLVSTIIIYYLIVSFILYILSVMKFCTTHQSKCHENSPTATNQLRNCMYAKERKKNMFYL